MTKIYTQLINERQINLVICYFELLMDSQPDMMGGGDYDFYFDCLAALGKKPSNDEYLAREAFG